ncbi:MAG TPA: TRAP transporter large permease [Clostridiales bacterium]|jgi:C4-dicarboxylate transporter DctM subunit|nr:TRAP transporter large permease [Clostridiales bacterium]
MTSGLLVILFFAFLIIGIPFAFSIILSCGAFLSITGFKPLVLIGQRLVTGMDSFPLLAVPLFILAGNLMDKGGISRRLVNWADYLVGRMTGGIGMVAVVSCMIFAALTGSGPATVAAIGSLLLPTMIRRGYKSRDAAGLVAAAGALGPIIPPSIPMIIYGVSMNVPITKMFMGGIGVGLLIGGCLMIVNYFYAKKNKISVEGTEFSLKGFLKATWNALGALLLPLIILGGIYGGVFTPTEAAAVAVMYSLILGGLLYKEIKLSEMPKMLIESTKTSAMVIFIIGAANILQWLLSATGLPSAVAAAAIKVVTSKITYLLLLNVILFIAGALIDTIAAIIILGPILVPIGLSLGLDPLHMGVLFVVNLVIGYVTPPFGYNLFTATSISGEPFSEVVKGVLPFLLVEVICVLIISFVPEIVTWLPSVLLK